MTPRQVIKQISERRYLQNITDQKVHFTDEKYTNVCQDTSWIVNKTEYETNKEIKESKLKEILMQSVDDPRSIPWIETTYNTNMYPTASNYLQGNAVLIKSRESPTSFYHYNKERKRNTSDVSFNTLYTTFKNANDGTNQSRAKIWSKSQKMDVVSNSKGKINSGHSEMSNIRGMAKKIHDKSTAIDDILTANEKDRLRPEIKTLDYKVTAKQFEEQAQKVNNSGTMKQGMDEKDSTKRIRLHIYLPTAEMNS